MKTDYENINSFEVGVVAMIIVGFVLVGALVFSSLVPRQQTAITSAFDMFDIHTKTVETLGAAVETVKLAIDFQEEFLAEFYVAFVEVATMPEDSLELPTQVVAAMYESVGMFADTVVTAFRENYSFDTVAFARGQVAGASIERTETLDLYYEYQPINIQHVWSNVVK